MRSISRFKGLKVTFPSGLTTDELLNARTFWLKETQRAYLDYELDICSQQALPRTHQLLKLSPFIDAEGILRVGGRLKNSLLDADSADSKHPAILPRHSSFSRLVISDIHQQTLHGGVQIVLATLRQQY